MRYSIDTRQLRPVSIRSWSFSRVIAFGATWILTCGPDRRNPNPGSVACAACRIEDFSRFTFSFSRRSITPQTLSNTLWAARSLRTKTRRSSAYADSRIMPAMRLDAGCARDVVLAWPP